MKYFLCFTLSMFLLFKTVHVWAETVTCTIEKSFTTGLVLEKPMVSTEMVTIEVKPFGPGHTFSLSPTDVQCELRVPNSKGGSFLNCWTPDKKHGFRSDRTAIEEEREGTNTLTYADGAKQLAVQIRVKCK
ncbi:MAG: hypothetical protein PHU49_06685 [Syntrophorhabdaceae bacterium]|nr:hypothetical protein [Syntrophorhabdaceae bacterium]MDD5243687.1 hypothetical protein [Syntrophorhabdaceae bacterium]